MILAGMTASYCSWFASLAVAATAVVGSIAVALMFLYLTTWT